MLKLTAKIIIALIALFLFSVQAKQSPLDQYFENKLNHLNESLIKNKFSLKNDSKILESFVNTEILPLWSSATTLKALLTTKEWNKISTQNQNKLIEVFNQTLHRYVREGMKYYDNQVFSFSSTKLGKKGNRGHLTILIEPEIIPSIKVTFKMTKIRDDWKLYDVIIAGVSYVKMKKLEIGRLYAEKGVSAVLESMQSKNVRKNKNKASKNLIKNSQTKKSFM